MGKLNFKKLGDRPVISQIGGHELVLVGATLTCRKCKKDWSTWAKAQGTICQGADPLHRYEFTPHRHMWKQISEHNWICECGMRITTSDGETIGKTPGQLPIEIRKLEEVDREAHQKELDRMAKKQQQVDIIIEVYEHHATGSYDDDTEIPKYFESGWVIETNRQRIWLLIDDQSSCCESWGYFITEDDPEKFIGEFISGITITDTNRSSRKFIKWDEPADSPTDVNLDSGDVMFVDIETSAGVFQFVAYNAHNGYYGHQARIVSDFLTDARTL